MKPPACSADFLVRRTADIPVCEPVIASSKPTMPRLSKVRSALHIHLAGIAAFISFSALAQTPELSPAPALSFDFFKLISERNIFNPNRRSAAEQQAAPRQVQTPPPRTETFALTGTLIHQGGTFAFFDGSVSDYRAVLKPGLQIAGFTITGVTQNSVKLKSDDAELDLAIGMQMRKRGDEKWQLIAERLSLEPAATNTTADSESSSDAAGEDDPILKRLLERRQKESQR